MAYQRRSLLVIVSPQIVSVGPEVPPEYAVGSRVCVENHFYCGHCYQCTHGELEFQLSLLGVVFSMISASGQTTTVASMKACFLL